MIATPGKKLPRLAKCTATHLLDLFGLESGGDQLVAVLHS